MNSFPDYQAALRAFAELEALLSQPATVNDCVAPRAETRVPERRLSETTDIIALKNKLLLQTSQHAPAPSVSLVKRLCVSFLLSSWAVGLF
jgi:hypothetical protein